MKSAFYFFIPIILFIGCTKEVVEEQAVSIGDYIEGGIVFFVDDSGEHGLVCAEEDLGFNVGWGCVSSNALVAEGLDVGSGWQNTINLHEDCQTVGTASEMCLSLNLNGYDDWFLPSRGELDQLSLAYSESSGGGSTYIQFNLSYESYWSSSEAGVTTIWAMKLIGGYFQTLLKSNHLIVRPIRAF